MLRNCSPYTFYHTLLPRPNHGGHPAVVLTICSCEWRWFLPTSRLSLQRLQRWPSRGLLSVMYTDTFSIYGEVIVLLLIQLGGLGILTLSSVIHICSSPRKSAFIPSALVSEGLNHEAKIDLYSHYQEGCLRCATYRGHRSGTALFCLCGTISVVQSSLLRHIPLSICILQCWYLSVSL